ncbi:Glycosyltransferase [Forsythia ovata]|uniref:Glycosyltransferase n=1 Tax=Forsythia ovata TaxID=205694 RepID=A0ABD1PX12_9LAMI
MADWCPQEKVLSHPSIGGFLTHSGWNSTLESLGNGVPMICWPFFAEQQTNCWFSCTKLGIGMEIDSDVKKDEVEILVKELMIGEKGKEMKGISIYNSPDQGTSDTGEELRLWNFLLIRREGGGTGQLSGGRKSISRTSRHSGAARASGGLKYP